MKKYLSFGAGVNSTALMLWLQDQGEEFENVFVNHGGDYPETYDYVDYLRDKGFEITEIIPNTEGCNTIQEYCEKYNFIPTRMLRWCTDKFKIRPIRNYVESPSIMFIGFSADENHRTFSSKPVKKGIENVFPLVDNGITRKGCKKIIKDHGLKVPRKSGCYFCPFMRKEEVVQLRIQHPYLYEKVKQMEKNCQRQMFLFQGKPIEIISLENIQTLDKFS